MSTNKTKITDKKVADYIATNPSEQKRKDAHILHEMFKEISGYESRMWGPSIIGFGAYDYKYESGHGGRAALLAFSPRKAKHVLYVLTNFEGQEILLEKLGKHKTGKVCLYINKLADVDLNILKEIVQASWDQNKHKAIDLT